MKKNRVTIAVILAGLCVISTPSLIANNPVKLLPACIEDDSEKSKTMIEYDCQNKIVKMTKKFEGELHDHIRHFIYNEKGNLDQILYYQDNDECKPYAIDFSYKGDTVVAKYTNGNETICVLDQKKNLVKETSILSEYQCFTRSCKYDDKGNMTRESTKGWTEKGNEQKATTSTYDCRSSYGAHVGVFSAVNVQPWIIRLLDVGYSCTNNRKSFEMVFENSLDDSHKIATSSMKIDLDYTYKNGYPEKIDYAINSNGAIEKKKVKIEYQSAL